MVYLTDLFNDSPTSGIFPQFSMSTIVPPFLKKWCHDQNDLYNYRRVTNLCFIAKILETLSYPMFFPTSTHTIVNTLLSQHIFLVTAMKQLF